MAFVNQAKKQQLAPGIKAVLTRYGVKGTISVSNHSTLVVTLKQGPVEFPRDRMDVNPYWLTTHYEGTTLSFLQELFAAMRGPEWYDNTDIQTDYFDVAHYVRVNVGGKTPYACTAQAA